MEVLRLHSCLSLAFLSLLSSVKNTITILDVQCNYLLFYYFITHKITSQNTSSFYFEDDEHLSSI